MSYTYSSVSVMSHIGGSDRSSVGPSGDSALSVQEYEFKIGSVGVGDSLGIVLASLVSIPLQVSLCQAQVARGRDLCTRIFDGKLFVIRINWECAYSVPTARSVRIVVSIVDFEKSTSIDPGSNPGRTFFFSTREVSRILRF